MNSNLPMTSNAGHHNGNNRRSLRNRNNTGRNVFSVISIKNIWKMVKYEPEWGNYVNIIETNNDKIDELTNELNILHKKNNNCRGDEITRIEKKGRELSVTLRNGKYMNDAFTEWKTKTFYRKKAMYAYDYYM